MQQNSVGGTTLPGHRIDTPAPLPVAYAQGLLKNPLIRAMNSERFAEFLEAAETVLFKPRQTIVEQSTPVDKVMFIVDGAAKAEVLPRYRGGLKVNYGLLLPGNDIGLLSVIACDHHSATVTAVEDVTMVCAPRTTLAELLLRNPDWYRILAEIAVHRLRTSGVWMRSLRTGAMPVS